MPYKDLERKKEWEQLHRPQRLARRRELRRIAATQRASQPQTPRVEQSGAGFLLPLIAAGALTAYVPKIGMGAGSLTLVIAALYRKGWRWWILGSVVLAIGLFFYWNKQNAVESPSKKEK